MHIFFQASANTTTGSDHKNVSNHNCHSCRFWSGNSLKIIVLGIYLTCLCQHVFYGMLVIGSVVCVRLQSAVCEAQWFSSSKIQSQPKVTQANWKTSSKRCVALGADLWVFWTRFILGRRVE